MGLLGHSSTWQTNLGVYSLGAFYGTNVSPGYHNLCLFSKKEAYIKRKIYTLSVVTFKSHLFLEGLFLTPFKEIFRNNPIQVGQ